MSINLEKSEKFQEDYTRYKTAIEAIENEKIKSEMEILLKQLVAEVKNIDSQHYQLFSKSSLPDVVNDSRYKIINIRKKIEKTLKDYSRAFK